MDYQQLAEQFIKRQETFYQRPLHNLNKFLLRDFAKFIEKNTNGQLNVQPITPKKYGKSIEFVPSKNTQIALITEDVGHLTGGRYYCWFIASALVELGYQVTVYTNRKPVFEDYFSKFAQPEIKVVCEKARELEAIDIRADIYFGSPISGDIAAARLGAKYHKPAFALIFDPFPMMDKFLGARNYPNWIPLLQALRSTKTNIISLCDSTSEYIYDWLNKRPEQVLAINPCINDKEYDPIPREREDYVVFISRLVRHKNFDHVLKACKKNGYKLKVISSIDGIGAGNLVQKMGMKKDVEFCMKVSDKEKFEILKKARVSINASIFEGFGMWFIEAITTGTPTVCYDYPTIREIAGKHNVKNVYMAKWNDHNDLTNKLREAWEEQKYSEPSEAFFFHKMVKRVGQVFNVEPKIGVITIALNEEQFIKSSLRSTIKHKNIKKVAVVEGAVNLFPLSNENGLSIDKTADAVRTVQTEPNGDKIIYERYGWANDKSELRNRALTLLGNDITHVLVVDADEVYRQEDLDNLVQAMKDNPNTGVFLYPFYHFWKNKNLVAQGGQWDSQMFRCFRYADKTLHWNRHEAPVVNAEGKFLNVVEGKVELDNVHVYHYGYCKDKANVLAKLEYYKKRDGHILDVKDTWSDWKEGDPTQPTHGGGTAVKFKGIHPPEVKGVI